MQNVQRPGDYFSVSQLESLRSISSARSTLAILHYWGVIVATWVVVSIWTNPLTLVLGVMVIGAQQLGLAVLNHYGAHGLLYENRRLNDWVCEWVLSRPLTDEKVDNYRAYHLKHHVNTQQADDPDLPLSKPFPISKASFRRKVIRDLTGQTGWDQYGRLFSAAFKGDTLRDRLGRS